MDDPSLTVDAPSNPPRRFRRTRIAVSVFFGLLTVALCVLWVRSYYRIDLACSPWGDTDISVWSQRGFVVIEVGTPSILGTYNFRYESEHTGYIALHSHLPGKTWYGTGTTTWLPYWALILVPLFLAATGLVGSRYSLRSLLIVAMLVALLVPLGDWLTS